MELTEEEFRIEMASNRLLASQEALYGNMRCRRDRNHMLRRCRPGLRTVFRIASGNDPERINLRRHRSTTLWCMDGGGTHQADYDSYVDGSGFSLRTYRKSRTHVSNPGLWGIYMERKIIQCILNDDTAHNVVRTGYEPFDFRHEGRKYEIKACGDSIYGGPHCIHMSKPQVINYCEGMGLVVIHMRMLRIYSLVLYEFIKQF